MFSPTQPLHALPPTAPVSSSPNLVPSLSLMFAPTSEAESKPAYFSPELHSTQLPSTSPSLAPVPLPPPVTAPEAEIEAAVEADAPAAVEAEEAHAEENGAPAEQQEPQPTSEETLQPVEAVPNGVAPAPGPNDEEQAAWESFAEEYYDIVTELPLEYERKFKLIRELEDVQQDSTEELKLSLKQFIAKLTDAAEKTAAEVGVDKEEVREDASGDAMLVDGEEQPKREEQSRTAPAPRPEGDLVDTREDSDKMQRILKAAIKAGEDKIALAQTLYEAVDRHIQRLDADLASNEDSLVIGLREGTLPSHDVPSLSLKEAPGPTTSRGAIALGELPPYAGDEEPQAARGKTAGLGKTGGKVGMSVDPNEPRYCFCNRVSFGEMIGCDNEDCKREWFHFECVNIKVRPEGDWFCADCIKKGAGQQPKTDARTTKRRRMH